MHVLDSVVLGTHSSRGGWVHVLQGALPFNSQSFPNQGATHGPGELLDLVGNGVLHIGVCRLQIRCGSTL